MTRSAGRVFTGLMTIEAFVRRARNESDGERFRFEFSPYLERHPEPLSFVHDPNLDDVLLDAQRPEAVHGALQGAQEGR